MLKELKQKSLIITVLASMLFIIILEFFPDWIDGIFNDNTITSAHDTVRQHESTKNVNNEKMNIDKDNIQMHCMHVVIVDGKRKHNDNFYHCQNITMDHKHYKKSFDLNIEEENP